MIATHRSILAALGVLVLSAPAAAQWPSPVGVAADADLIAIHSPVSERRLLRLRFDRSAGEVSIVPFGPTGVEIFAAAPNGSFVVHAGAHGDGDEPSWHLFLLDEAGQPLGKPLPSPIGAIAELAVSPKGDWVAASNGHGWMALFAIERSGSQRRLVARTPFGVSPERAFTYAFRPDGGLMTLTDDWIVTYRATDGSAQRTLDLKIANPDLTPAARDDNVLFKLKLSPRGDRFAVSWGGGPLITSVFDAAGRQLDLGGAGGGKNFPASDVEFVGNGEALIPYGMVAPVLIRLASRTSTAFGGPDTQMSRVVSLAGGRTIAVLADDQAALWSNDGKRLTAMAGLENYEFGLAAAGADNEAIVAATRGGWVDLYTKQGKFLRRVQSGARGSFGQVAVSADGRVVAAFGSAELGVIGLPGGRAWGAAHSQTGSQDYFVAAAGNHSRIATAGPSALLRSWSGNGTNATTFTLDAGGRAPGRLTGLAVSTSGEAIALADENSAVWLARPADKSVRRVALPAAPRSVAALPDNAGFAVGMADGTVVRIANGGDAKGPPLEVAEFGGVGRIAVAPDGQSFIAVEDDEISARHLAWDGKVLAGPVRARRFEAIKGAFFRDGAPILVMAWRDTGPTAEDHFSLVELAAPGTRRSEPFDRPKP